ncbi:tryptophan-rich sensory protein [Aureibaculum marinum]|uniref:Tryptophan-rich sensory protein n=1 Tax=Aureibaculum marinum TaxID=2487930 RepID=A0A3N4N989_9FLAO|nr:TspO/MBR family protein [Aureibaculum marinum]RPD90747.1 tryptophan-rich sensory protein [Aureibaculum marinum]
MKYSLLVIVFLVINFTALGVGSWLMNNGPQTEWYINLNKAPWTPPGWVFGAAWTIIMICFSIYMAQLYSVDKSALCFGLFVIQVVLNVSWNYVFFNQHHVGLALVIITLLTLLIIYFFITYYSQLKLVSLLLGPYIIWLLIATSLNYYIYSNN